MERRIGGVELLTPRIRVIAKSTTTPAAIWILCGAITLASMVAGVVLQGGFPISDNAMFQYVGRALVRGSVLYRDVWDNKLPGIYCVNALGYLLFRDDYRADAIAEVGVALGSAALLLVVIQSFDLGNNFVACTALLVLLCCVFTLNSTEAYALPLILASVLAARKHFAIASAIAVGLATLFWIPSALMAVPVASVMRPRERLTLALTISAVAAVVLITIVLTFGYAELIALVHSWIAYISTPPTTIHHKLAFLNRLPGFADSLFGMRDATMESGVAALCAFFLAVIRRPATLAQRFGLLWIATMFLGALVTRHFYSHYFIPSAAALLFTIAAYWHARVITLSRLALFAVAFALSVKTVLDAWASWHSVSERSAIATRIAGVVGPIVAGRLTLETDAYTPDLYLGLDPILRSPYEIVASGNQRFVREFVRSTLTADVEVHRITKATGTTVCERTASPWNIVVRPSVASQFRNCP